MIATIIVSFFVFLFFCYVAWSKYKKYRHPAKQWEGGDPNERKKSTEEMRLDQNKYRGFIGPM